MCGEKILRVKTEGTGDDRSALKDGWMDGWMGKGVAVTGDGGTCPLTY
jgi:hypothetical protein